MEIIGHISFKEIFYCNVRTDNNWFDQLPSGNWIAFTIADNEDSELITHVTNICLNKGVTCICCAGQFASDTEDSFVDGIIERNNEKEQEAGRPAEESTSPMLTLHRNFSEGFWFATNIANLSLDHLDIDKVVCIDMTKESVKKHLRDLVGKFNAGELPSDNEFEKPLYDFEIT